jgi:hypothetical protein
MILPNPALAIIDEDKLSGYSLNTEHSEGKHKARVFKSVLNMDVPTKQNAYGQKYIIDFPLSHEDKTATIHSVWIVRLDEDFPRLITCYVL